MKKSGKKSKNEKKFKWPFSKPVTIILSIVLFLIIALVVGIAVLYAWNWKPTAAFYGISEKNRNAIIEVLQKTAERERGGKKVWPYEIEILDSSYSLEKALKSPATFILEEKDSKGNRLTKTSSASTPELLFIYRGKNEEFAVQRTKSKDLGLSDQLLEGMSTNIKKTAVFDYSHTAERKTVNENGEELTVEYQPVAAVPLLIDNYEIDLNSEMYRKNSIKNVELTRWESVSAVTWKDFENLAEKNKNNMGTVIMNCSNDYDFINIFGALVESVSGFNALKSASEKIWEISRTSAVSYNAYFKLISEMSENGGELHDTVEMLKKWLEKSYTPKNLFQFGLKDLKAYMNENIPFAAFMTLSNHRTVEQNTISRYSSIFYPSEKFGVERTFTSPVIMAVPYGKSSTVRESVRALAAERQTELSRRSGLAPVLSQCGVPDLQADDVRWLVAATNVPFEGLAEAAFKTSITRSEFAEALKSFLH